ncbi:trace amine-associated receptor 6-like [Periophthalmus magnuspinnatus]|uniref:trace amine-associated receptor 6-like n=1 Tax=Periophthalmus magnuspinnatus TaxID=409849 RepID=UPI00145B65EC|nr:trace amine-associated receptor 6-like [Periophthalmus magnuspinnatus]
METAELCFPHLHNSSCIKYQANIFEINLVSVLLSLLSTLTAALNLLVIISISHFRQLHSTTNLILLSLAVSDLIVGLVDIPIFGTMWKVCWYFGELLCGLVYLVPCTSIMASVGTVVLISVDRYVAICDPMHYPTRMTEKVVGVSISVCWIYAFLAASQARAIRSNTTTMISKTSRKSEIKAARNLGILVLVYLMCHSPYYFVAFSEANILVFGVPIQLVSIYLYFLNACINPLMYAMLYPWFRKAIKLVVTLQILKHGSCDLKIL